MIIKFSLSAAVILASLASAQAQTPGNIIFQGEFFVTAISTPMQCASYWAVGDFDRVVYRYKPPNTNNDPDSLAFIETRNANRIESTTASGSLNGLASVRLDGINSKASLFSDVLTTSDLTIVPVSPAKTIGSATNILITGTVKDFGDVTGCTVSIRAVLTLRVD
jgi:hypothetical protein